MDNFSAMLFTTLKKYLRVCRTNSSKTEIMIRCVYCGDSIKNPSSAHFYIQTYSPYYCYCQRCGTKSSVSVEFLNDFKVPDQDLKLEVMRMQKERKYDLSTSKKRGSNKFIDSVLNTNKFDIPFYTGTKGELRRLKYINDRLGTSISINEARQLNIILNLKEFIVQNDITITLNSVIERLPILNKHCVGFLSQDKNFIIFRSLDTEITGFRYFNFNITGKHDNTRKFYTIKQSIDLMNPNVKIVVTEGIMDLLSVYFNIYKGVPPKDNSNIVFISTNGIGMNLVINTVCKLGFLDPEIEIYADNGVDLRNFKQIKETNPFITPYNKMKVFYNKASKDVGVPFDQIDLKYSYI